MPTTVKDLFEQHQIKNLKQIQWGTKFSDNETGIYIISTSNQPDQHLCLTDEPIFDDNQINHWINKLDCFLIDNEPPTIQNIKARLTQFWLPDESILYIGKAPKRSGGKGISNRIIEYYNTTIGDRGPHSGGQWIKVLKNIGSFTIYYGYTDKPDEVEKEMFEMFKENVSDSSLTKLYDKNQPLPFANIRCRGDKKHGMKNQRLKRVR